MRTLAYFIAIIICFTILQMIIAKRKHLWEGLIIPFIYFVVNYRNICLELPSKVTIKPNYYEAAVWQFAFIWLLMDYYIFYYYWIVKEKKLKMRSENDSLIE